MNKPEKGTVFITGATSGIGKACAEVFASNGHPLVITGRRSERLTAISEGLTKKYGVEIVSLTFDIRSPKACDKAWNSLDSNWKSPDLLINNAGLAKGLDPIHQGSLDHWETMIDTNVKGLLYITRLISPGMVERKGGHIINVCSTAGHETYPMGNVYCATKHAVNALTSSMRLDLYTHGIKVGQVSPAHVEETEFAVNRFDGDEKKGDIYSDFNPLQSTDVAEAIYFIYTRPAHVNIQDILMMGTQQAGSNFINRSGRIY